MKSISELKKEQQDKLSAIFEKYGIFFAFSNEQFNSQKKEGVTYVRGVGGMLIPKENAKDFVDAFSRYSKDCETEYQEHVSMNDYIAYELVNNEAWYTGDISVAFEAVQILYPECTIEDVRRVYENKRS